MTPDVIEPPQLTDRQEKILALVVHEYINQPLKELEKPEPVGSKYLAERFPTNISSATIRNELATLEELGYLTSPHTSAGRVPTEAGYRYFVKRLLDAGDLPVEERERIANEFSQANRNVEQWMQLAVSTLARASRGAALVTAPRAFNSQFKHIELISTQGRLVLMVLVLYGGDVRQQMLTLADTVPQETLSSVARQINMTCDALTAEQLRAWSRSSDSALAREVLDIAADVLDLSDQRPHIITHRDGLSGVLPEFTESQGQQQVLRLMEEGSLLADILSEALDQNVGHVQVVIAGEGRWSEVTHVSMVLGRYGVNGQATGTLGVLGPTRMRYGRAISAVRYIAGIMSNLLLDAYGETSNE